MAKADNMLAILWLLKSRRRMTAKQLSDELEIHIRTVYRCIDALCVSGVPIVSETGRDGGYHIPDSVKLEPLFFDVDEQKSLLQAAAFAREAGYPDGEALERAVSKIKRYTNPRQLERLERQEASLGVIHPPSAPSLMSALALIENGIDMQISIEIEYRSGYDGPSNERTVDPYGLVHWKSKWYAVGYCRLRGEIRSFRVDRMSRIRLKDAVFERPPHFSAREFLLGSLLPDSDAEQTDQMISVLVQGTPRALDDICRHWLLGHALVERTSDRALFKLDELRLYAHTPYYLLSFGGTIRVLEPAELKSHMIDLISSLLDYYRS
ncbi:MAG: Helix-turn-helix type 11 domain protein [Paenibacillus sp.]|nr:Helix-turn-helix type 11 domain protein [Paenibacillus sp.]